MSEQAGSPIDSFLRLCVIVGVVIVGFMAYHLYGPPLGEASDLLGRVIAAGGEAIDHLQREISPEPQAVRPAPIASVGSLTTLPPASSPRKRGLLTMPLAPLEPPAATLPPLTPRASVGPPNSASPATQALLASLAQLGATDFHLTNWGADGGWQRFDCTVPLPGSTGFVQHFDAIEATPHEAIAKVVRQVQQWRSQQSTPRVASLH